MSLSFLVLLELFTSQGCSSCPPADRLLTEISADPRVLTLAYHVDYWDDLGRKDPFSAAEWTRRQNDYAASLRGRGLYTPQLVVGGAVDAVGSDRGRIGALIDRAAAPSVKLELTAVTEGDAIRVRATTTPALAANQTLLVAVAESGITTEVVRGENAGRTLTADHIVRRLVTVGPDGVAILPLDRRWDRKRLEIVGFVQERPSMKVLGAMRAAR